MDAFFGITLSIIVLYVWWRSETRKPDPRELRRNTVKARWDRKRIRDEKTKREAATAKRETGERKKQQDEEVITVILPTIKHDK